MKKLYLDCTGGETVSVYVRDAEVIPAGTTVYTMPLRERGRSAFLRRGNAVS